jgi:MOSC domain-containing protein YiiM
MRHGMYPDVRLHLPSARSESRQVHLIRCDFLELLRKLGHDLSPGDLGENVMAVGLDLERLTLGTGLHLRR